MAKNKNKGLGAYICLLVFFMLSQSAWAITYEYDDLNRLVKATYDNGAVITYSYDAAGNITGTRQIPVEKAKPEPTPPSTPGGGGSAPQAVLSLPTPGFIDLGAGLIRAAFPVSNKYRQGTLVWTIGSAQYSGAAKWITSVEPASGATADETMVIITASRSGLQPGVYNATLPVTSNGGDGSITIRMEVSQSAPPPETECSADRDCDDGLYCNGAERCLLGVCAASTKPCGDGQICSESTDTCMTTKMITATGIKNRFSRPVFRAAQQVWLVLKSSETNHFNKSTSTISLATDNGTGQGVSVDKSRSSFKLLQFIFVPLVVEKTATPGTWSVSIGSALENSVQEIVSGKFQVL